MGRGHWHVVFNWKTSPENVSGSVQACFIDLLTHSVLFIQKSKFNIKCGLFFNVPIIPFMFTLHILL